MNTRMKSLFGYIFPALGGLFVTYLYNVVDGIFVGQGVGAAALGAVNIGVPFITFVIAIAAMFPMGGATVVAIRMGRGDKGGANHAFMTAFSMTINTILSIAIYGVLFFFDAPVIRIFNKEPELVQTATAALPLFALSFVPMAYNLIYTAFLFSTKRTGMSNVIAISRGIVLKAMAIFLIPLIAGTDAIWIAPFVAEIITLIIAIVLKKTSKLVYQ